MATKNKKNQRVYDRRRSDKKAAERRADQKKRTPGWVWLLVGLVPGLGVALLVYLMKDESEVALHETKVTTSSALQQEEPVAPLPPQPEARYDFYKSLQDMKIFIPDEEEIVTNKRSNSETKEIKQPGAYIFQVASFKEHKMADALKAKLAILGIKSGIQSVTIENGSTWHRVRIGPIHELPRLHEVKLQLQQNDIEFILLKLKG
ncbi:MAG TPA: hypothetical protein ENJ07_02030 [Gammaproteobacteria bacterium]|nr:hypothetical protein [Gammaproteobacteria bacterium]